ncbi:MAG TPA: nucleotidyltransferase family protein [Gemmatimonadaceae bacterium]
MTAASTTGPEWLLAARLAARVLPPSELPPAAVDWERVLEIAAEERVASLAWLRNAATIRAAAPAEVAARWRGRTLAAGATAREMALELADVVRALEQSGVTPIVLKGLPLAQVLYGDVTARPVNDIDLFVPLAQRDAAHGALCGFGYRHRLGEAPAEGTYERIRDGRRSVVEVHSTVLDEEMLAHLPMPTPEGEAVDVEGVRMYAQRGALLPLFLALHLAKHAEVPLLWWIDIATVWERLSAGERAAVRSMAVRHRVERHLEWAEQGIALLATVVNGELPSAERAAGQLRARHESHPVRRLASLASGLRDAARIALAWVWPRHVRRQPLTFARQVATRLIARLRRARTAPALDVSSAPLAALRALAVSDEQLLGLVREVVGGGAPMWIRARGSSMSPTVKDGALVRLVPLPARPLRRGDVVFAVMRGGKAVLHRVLEADAESVLLQGDNMAFPDAPLTRGDVIALADTVQQDTRASAIAARPPLNPSRVLARWRSRRVWQHEQTAAR